MKNVTFYFNSNFVRKIWNLKVESALFLIFDSIRILKEREIKSERSQINCDIFSSFVKCIGLHPMLVDRSSV